ncbi:MAG: hypothetical protein R2795_06140 [Saprospiraceae bacterium]
MVRRSLVRGLVQSALPADTPTNGRPWGERVRKGRSPSGSWRSLGATMSASVRCPSASTTLPISGTAISVFRPARH